MSTIARSSIHENASAPSLLLRRRALAAFELVVVIAALEICLWHFCGTWNDAARWIAAPVIAITVAVSHRRRSGAASLPAAARGSAPQAWLSTLAVTAALALLIPLVALASRVEGEGLRLFWLEKGTAGLLRYLAGKGAFIVVQQWLLQYFLLPCCCEIVPHRRAAQCCAALLFGVVHLPSLLLVGITTIASYCWLGLFASGRRIAPLAASHLALAVLAHAALPERLTLNMRVGTAAQEVAERYRVLDDAQFAPQVRALCSDDYYSACGGSDDGFIAALYRDVLERHSPASAPELAGWREKLAAHARADIVVEFLRSQEFAALPQADRAARVADRVAERLARSGPPLETSIDWH